MDCPEQRPVYGVTVSVLLLGDPAGLLFAMSEEDSAHDLIGTRGEMGGGGVILKVMIVATPSLMVVVDIDEYCINNMNE